MRGRKPKPTKLKLLSGTARKHRLNEHEPTPDLAQPDPPEHLTGAARLEWERVIEEIVQLGIMSNLDRAPLAAYCQAYGRWVAAEAALARMAEKDGVTEGLIVRTKAGNVIHNPLVGAANKAMADMVRYAAEFGFTPSSRSQVSAVEAPDEDNPFSWFDTA
ncbi:phage terminase small subunit P27 family [uncultured Roseovarius sp.]|uniref:phage terminase small subunit P27 family n=1 Tax=uncultured Roseovarius sp. TaxID=293344 RepID=UPI00262DC4E4|nr:phage terminase small subunit P27 family [uncultured Roseovarius sp.]